MSDSVKRSEEQRKFLKEISQYKEKYIAQNSIESMVYENGAATALLFKEVQRLSQLITTYINGKDETTTETD